MATGLTDLRGHIDLLMPGTMRLASATIVRRGESHEVALTAGVVPTTLQQIRNKPRWVAHGMGRYEGYVIDVVVAYNSDRPELSAVGHVRLPPPESLAEEECQALLDTGDIAITSLRFERVE